MKGAAKGNESYVVWLRTMRRDLVIYALSISIYCNLNCIPFELTFEWFSHHMQFSEQSWTASMATIVMFDEFIEG